MLCYDGDMTYTDTIERYMAPAKRLVAAEAIKQGFRPADCEDIFQETMLRVLRYPIRMENARASEQFFLGAMRRVAMQVMWSLRGARKDSPSYREQGERNTFDVGLFQELTDGDTGLMDERMLLTVPSAEDAYLATVPTRRQEALRGALSGLAPRQREAISLRYFEELSVPDVAAKMGLSEAQAKGALRDGMKTLKGKLNPRG